MLDYLLQHNVQLVASFLTSDSHKNHRLGVKLVRITHTTPVCAGGHSLYRPFDVQCLMFPGGNNIILYLNIISEYAPLTLIWR